MRSPRIPLLLLALASVVPAPPAPADILVVNGRPVRCTWWEDGDDVVVNPYNSTNRAMTYGVERVPKSRARVKDARPTETPEEEYCRRAFDARAGDAEAHRELARWCGEKKLKDLAAREWERVLERAPEDAEARKALGDSAVRDVLRRSGRANPALGEILAAYLASDSAAARRVLYERAVRDHGYDLPVTLLERAWRSGRLPKGRKDDVPLTLRSKEVKGHRGTLYTMFVPSTYDPLVPTPLVVGLHGGGPGGKDGKEVTGSGSSAMNFYTDVAEERGWLVACPSAIAAPWKAKENGPFLEAMLDELALLYNVDLNRVYLTGHSMGGFGTWHWGPEWAERWAAIAPMAGGGGPAAGRLKETHTPVYVFHGADDNVVGVGGDRAAAEALLKNGNEFVYTELNGVGHGFPPEVAREMAAYFEVKRLAVGKGRAFRRSDEIRSSFLERWPVRLLREEKVYLGDPEPPKASAEKPEEERKRLLAEIDLGGGKADVAAARLAELRDEGAVKGLAQRLASAGRVADDVRAACARALGGIGAEEGFPALRAALSDEVDVVFLAAVEALEAAGDRGSGAHLLKALDFQARLFDGKRQGDGMSYNDFEHRCAALGRTALAAAALASPADAVARIRDRVVNAAVLAPIRVPGLDRAGMFPEDVRAALAVQCLKALGRTSDAGAVPVIAALRERFKGHGPVQSAADEAEAALRGTEGG